MDYKKCGVCGAPVRYVRCYEEGEPTGDLRPVYTRTLLDEVEKKIWNKAINEATKIMQRNAQDYILSIAQVARLRR